MKLISEILSNPKYAASAKSRITKNSVPGNANDCWEWKGWLNDHGYAMLGIGGVGKERRNIRASRIQYYLHYGKFDETLCVLHNCDNPNCINPDHLFLGTKKDNTQDMKTKGRESNPPIHKGEAHHKTKFGKETVMAILASQDSYRKLSQQYNVSVQTIFRIKHGLTWQELQIPVIKTNRDNYQGENNPSAKLNWEKIRLIRNDKRPGSIVAKNYGVDKGTINAIRRFRTWKHDPIEM
jgi:HNH endonuclease